METGTRVQIDWPGKTIFGDGRPHDYELHGLYGEVVRVEPDMDPETCLVKLDGGPIIRVPLEHIEEHLPEPSRADIDRLMSAGRRSLADLQARVGWDPNAEEAVSGEEINRYIEALEGQVVGQAMAMKTIGDNWKPPRG